jgi:long-chain acyl-CoA synthetase
LAGISRAFFGVARNSPAKIAIYCDGESRTYGELANHVSRLSHALISKGVKRGEHIGVLIPDSIEFVTLMLVAADLGVVLVPLNTTLPVSAIHNAFISADVKHVILTSEILKTLHSSNSCDFSFISGLWLSFESGNPEIESLKDLLGSVPITPEPMFSGEDKDPYILTMTSGSTGDPKPIVLTQLTKFNRAMAAIEMYGLTASDITLAATPLYHSLAERLVLIPLLTGGTSILMTRFTPLEWLHCINKQFVTFTIAVSSQLGQIAKYLNSNKDVTTNSLRCVVSSSALLDPTVKETLLATLQCEFHECYGTSEIAIASSLDLTGAKKKYKSVGTAAAGVDIKIIDENDNIAEAGIVGEIVCLTPMLFGGYYKRPEQTQKAMWGKYFRTGDLGMLDQEGFLYFKGRGKELIITGGINVYPPDIESEVSKHPMVKECAAFPLADEQLGEIIAVAIVPTDNNKVDLRKIRHHCAQYLADFQQPRKYYFVNELPKNNLGKIMKQALVDMYNTI